MRTLAAVLVSIVAAAACGSEAPKAAARGPGLPPAEPGAPAAIPTADPAVTLAGAPAPAAAAAKKTEAFLGVVTTKQSKVVVASFEGRVESLLVHAGQTVAAGEPIARLDSSQLALQVESARAREAAARSAASQASAEKADAKRRYKLEKDLLADGATTREAVIAAKQNIGRTGSGEFWSIHKSAQAERERLEALLANATIAAPIGGIVSAIRVKEGELAMNGTPVARIFDPSDRWIRFAVPPEQRAEFPVGGRVAVTVTGSNAPLVATIATVSNVMEPPLQLTVIEADLDDGRPETALAEVGSMVDVRRMP
jgi:multidrug efflux pump subunit AcrA (membrane-fusion protein)